VCPVQGVAHQILENRVSQELKPLIVIFPDRWVRQSAAKQRFVAECVPQGFHYLIKHGVPVAQPFAFAI
jgi:tRNA G46 methylase TrmB